ncbi:MAG: permease prefix domain 1-containing protein [Armatimonadota bacterium]
MDEQPFEQLVDDVTAGLKADPELRLDIRAELLTHLGDTAEHFTTEGKSPEESAEQAARVFGSPLEIAGELLEANRRRMRLRALVRLVAGALLLPVALLVALYTGYGRFARLTWSDGMEIYSSTQSRPPQLPLLNSPAQQEKMRKIQSVVDNLAGKESNADRLRAYWEARRNDPDARIYYAYYSSSLYTLDDKFASAMRLGEQIEPDNAMYNYRLAWYYLSKGMIAKAEKRKEKDQVLTDEILDQHAMELGVAEYRKGVAKPYLNDYKITMLQKKLGMLPTPRLTEDYMQRMVIAASELFPALTGYRTLARKIPGCARLLITKGQREEAEALLSSWHIYPMQIIHNSDTLIHVQVGMACTVVIGKESADIFDSLGRATQARQIREKVVQIDAAVKKQKIDPAMDTAKANLNKHNSVIASIMLPVFGGYSPPPPPTSEELAPSRYHEQTLLEEVALTAVLLLLVFAMVASVTTSAYWFFNLRAAKAAPLLLLPRWQETLRVVALGILLPLAVYYLYSRSPWGGREYGFGYMWPRVSAEFLVIMLVLLYLPAAMAGRLIRRRCETLGVPTPSARTNRRQKIALYSLGVLLVLLCVGTTMAFDVLGFFDDPLLLLLCIIVPLLYTAGFWYVAKSILRSRKSYALFYGTVARSLAPVYALSIILLATLVYPYLIRQEERWLREDHLIFSSSTGFGTVEERAVKRLKAKVEEAMK